MISAIILTNNEQENIEACIASVAWCDEIIVIDDNSTDKTISLAKKAGAIVISHPMQGSFAAQRNYGLSQAKGDWVLFVDADERVSNALWYEIMQHVNESFTTARGYFIQRKDTIWGRQLLYGETGSQKLLRLARKSAGEWKGTVHEVWDIKGHKQTLRNHLDHFPHQSIAAFLKEINYYTDLRAKELFDRKVKSHWWTILLYPSGKFVHNYVLKRGFLDGIAGIIVAITMSFHSFLVRSKLWLLWNK